jgi:hypothetical protein
LERINGQVDDDLLQLNAVPDNLASDEAACYVGVTMSSNGGDVML